MPNIRPVSDLRNYTDVLKEISEDAPVFLTKNGRGRYVITDIEDYKKEKAKLKLLAELAKGELSAKNNRWIDADKVTSLLEVK